MADTPTRRAIVAGFAVAGTEGLNPLPFVRPARGAITSSGKADADLIRLVKLVVEADVRRDAFDEDAEKAFDLIEGVPIPEALEHRRDIDFPCICCDQNRCAQYRSSVADPWRSIYETPDALTPWAQSWLRGESASIDARFFTEMHHARMREIAAAFERWDCDRKRAEAAAGYDVPAQASARETEIINDLLRQIAVLPARTLVGLAAKVRTAIVARSFFPGQERELQRMLDGSEPPWDEAFMTSIFADIASIVADA